MVPWSLYVDYGAERVVSSMVRESPVIHQEERWPEYTPAKGLLRTEKQDNWSYKTHWNTQEKKKKSDWRSESSDVLWTL